mgnify:CR=1 FL=1
MIQRAYQFRIYPNASQKEFFAKCFGCVRFFYNRALDEKIQYYKEYGKTIRITPAKYKQDFEFLKEVDSLALANAQLDLEQGYKNFFRNNARFPKYKSKKNEQSYTTNNQGGNVKFTSNDKYITIPKCKCIRVRKHRNFIGTIKSVTIRKTCDEKYYISLLVEEDASFAFEQSKNSIGIDLGIKDIAVDSNGKKYENPKFLDKSLAKLQYEERKLSHMQKGSKNRNKQRIKLAKIHRHITNQRKDFFHKLSYKLVKENQLIAVENLKVKDMEQNKNISRSIFGAGWSKFIEMLEYKSKWYGRTFIKVDTYFPSSQICSCCGYQNPKIKNLSIRSWTCPSCGNKHDRDVNAAKNILLEAIRILKAGKQPDSLLILDSLESLSKKPPLQN